MTNQERMLKLVLSDSNLIEYYDLDTSNIFSIADALSSDNAIIATIAKIIRGLNGDDSSSKRSEVYREVFNYLNNELI